ncbi:MAG: trypsin-like peptidase domain-containing protein [Pirellulales bacterium]|nr:trypsin-like peptidase domain-containing protein [Pirellulales bacterium]
MGCAGRVARLRSRAVAEVVRLRESASPGAKFPRILTNSAAGELARVLLIVFALCPAVVAAESGPPRPGLSETVRQTQAKVVKIYGAGGFQQMEAYQTGMLVSPEGHILTVWSYVLDTDSLAVVLADGRRFEAKLLGADPRLEIAVVKIEGADLPHFDLNKAVEAEAGQRVLALSNLFGIATGNEPASVQDGVIAVKTQLQARRGVFETPYDGPVYVLDAVTNNPGAAGGVLVTRSGDLIAMLGKELRNALNNTWLNYALPIEQLRGPVEQIRAGKFVARREEPEKRPERPITLADLGLVLVPDVVERTPPFVDRVVSGSPAAVSGIRMDDLVLLIGDRLVPSCKSLREELGLIDREDPVKLTVLRGQELLEFELHTEDAKAQTPP